MRLPFYCILALGTITAAETQAQPSLKFESFDRDPGWEGHNNRIELKAPPVVKQDFDYSATQFAGKSAGEIGGRITRTTKPSYYAMDIAPKTLDDPLAASGSFAIKASQPGAGVFFGSFTGALPGGLELEAGYGVMEWHDVRW